MGPTESELIGVLHDAGKPLESHVHPDGTRLLLLPYGARVLGLFAPGSEENFFWIHPALSSAESALALFAITDWQNTGGDRTWLGPEVDIFFPNFPDLAVWQVPPQLDPGNYAAVNDSTPPKFAADIGINLFRSGQQVEARITKCWSPAPNPLRYEASWPEGDVLAYAGYTQEISLELKGSGSPVPVGLWDLLAAPSGGEVMIPTHVRTEPEIYTGTIAPTDLLVSEHLVRFHTPGAGIRKIGVRAAASTGRLGYIYPSRDAWALIVKNFIVNPSGEYIDVPWQRSEASDARGFSTQACSVQTGVWDYCELEHHVPAIGLGTGDRSCRDLSQVWAFRGQRGPILDIAQRLLSSEL